MPSLARPASFLMPHVIEPATSARAKCRGCGERIAAGTLRFGESLPNPFADGETIHWFHLDCGAFKRPEPFLEALEARSEPLQGGEGLGLEARRGVEHPRLPRINGAERAPTARAQCRSCREAIAKGAWRIPLVFYEDGRFAASGFIHARCARAYFETADVLPRLRRFAPDLGDVDLRALQEELDG
jgi:Poly(ADP-ribose) polymerase and DNA-Ligase Zn-finger region